MPISFPYIPSYITVHLGAPSANVENVTVSFIDYLKNVASSEVYPTWEENALRANVLAITSFALNRVYTEFYRSRGYNFDITASTAYDQQFVKGRNFFRPISVIVNQLYDSYLRRRGFIEPLAAKFCNGTTVTCAGLSQWGSQYLAQQGYSSIRIVRNYYGTDVDVERNAPLQEPRESYPGTPLRLGSTGPNVLFFQRELNRVSQNYPAIPKVAVDGIFGPATENAVRVFQQVFGLSVDGIVGRVTWYELVRLYVGVKNLAELQSEGLQFAGTSFAYPGLLQRGSSGQSVLQMQYMLAIVGKYIPSVPVIDVDGIFGSQTEDAVRAFQRYNGLSITGRVDAVTWNALYDQFAGIENLDQTQTLGAVSGAGAIAVSNFTARDQLHALGYRGNNLRQEVSAFQRQHELRPTGQLDQKTETELRACYSDLSFCLTVSIIQFPGVSLELGSRDPEQEVKS